MKLIKLQHFTGNLEGLESNKLNLLAVSDSFIFIAHCSCLVQIDRISKQLIKTTLIRGVINNIKLMGDKVICVDDLGSVYFNGIQFNTNASAWGIAASDNLLAVSNNDFIITVFDLNDNNSSFQLNGHEHNIPTIDFNKNCTLLVSGSIDNTSIIWDLKTRQSINRISLNDWIWTAKFVFVPCTSTDNYNKSPQFDAWNESHLALNEPEVCIFDETIPALEFDLEEKSIEGHEGSFETAIPNEEKFETLIESSAVELQDSLETIIYTTSSIAFVTRQLIVIGIDGTEFPFNISHFIPEIGLWIFSSSNTVYCVSLASFEGITGWKPESLLIFPDDDDDDDQCICGVSILRQEEGWTMYVLFQDGSISIYAIV